MMIQNDEYPWSFLSFLLDVIWSWIVGEEVTYWTRFVNSKQQQKNGFKYVQEMKIALPKKSYGFIIIVIAITMMMLSFLYDGTLVYTNST